jgi:hypothetical protein
VSGASEPPRERPGPVDVSVFRNAAGNGMFRKADPPRVDRAVLAAGRSRILVVGAVRGFRLAGRPRSVVMDIRVEETLKGAGLIPGRMLRVDLGRRDNLPGSGLRAGRDTVRRYRAAVPRGSRFLLQLTPREGRAAERLNGFRPSGPASLVFEGGDGLVGAYADLPETWTEQRSITGLRNEIFHRLRSDGTVCTPVVEPAREAGGPPGLRFEDCLPAEERRYDRRIRKACQGISSLRPVVRMSDPDTDLECLEATIEG